MKHNLESRVQNLENENGDGECYITVSHPTVMGVDSTGNTILKNDPNPQRLGPFRMKRG